MRAGKAYNPSRSNELPQCTICCSGRRAHRGATALPRRAPSATMKFQLSVDHRQRRDRPRPGLGARRHDRISRESGADRGGGDARAGCRAVSTRSAKADFERLLEARPDVVLLGTGSTLRFPHPRLTRALAAAHVGLEVMDTRGRLPHVQHPLRRRPARHRGADPVVRYVTAVMNVADSDSGQITYLPPITPPSATARRARAHGARRARTASRPARGRRR